MTYKTVMVHLDTSAGAHTRLSFALKLARKFDAHLDGVFAMFDPHPVGFYAMTGAAEHYDAHRKFLAQKRDEAERLFRAELSRAGAPGTWVAPEGYAVAAVLQRSRTADLIILGQPRPKDPESFVADNFLETVLLGAGGPVLLVPETCGFESVGERVLVGWNGGREAARAVHDAIPFIARAARVTIAAVPSAFAPGSSAASCAEVATMLERHVTTPVDVSRFDHPVALSTGETLLEYATDGGYDLLVAGAYGHARFQEFILGGATRSILSSMTLPVLMSH
ncbi:universal stress protein [Paraburkholderia lycopersici]|uniref:Nucleotide-binding universal stress protein, UspA family n=1 Tax=Paraburkholderia lycopersici TaxID=416944 RepID=A0A1G6SFK6_9BURK|nr:universal stress protein [Paraburkholderia lycopersici]SDD15658.1 Nucleotide-binding universal stress protein, UspA family [Paraburkholderia lycopersici]